MWPLAPPLHVGIQRTAWRELRRGDLVAVVGQIPGTGVLHRLHAIGPSGLQTRGDTCVRADEPLPHAALLGRAVALRLGPIALPIAVHGPSAALLRATGLRWSAVAPQLRRVWSTLSKC